MSKPHVWEIDCKTMTWIREPMPRRRLLGMGAGALAGMGMLGALSACGGDGNGGGGGGDGDGEEAGGGGEPGEGMTIALSLNGFNTYDQDTAEGCLKALEGTAYRFIGAEAAFDATTEVENIRQLIARQPDGLIVLAASAEGAARASAQAKSQGIPVVAQIWFPVSEEVDAAAYYAATQLEPGVGGQLTIDYITQEAGIEEGQILEMTGLDAQPFTVGFSQGLRAALEEHPGLEIVASQQGFYTADGAVEALRPMLSANPDANIIIDYAAEMGVAIANELQRRGDQDILHITSDGNDAMIPWLSRDDGAYLKADRWYSPGEQGIASVNVLRSRLENDEDPTDENIGLEGWTVEEGTADPIIINTRQEMATAENIEALPPFGYDEFADEIPFGG